VRRLRIAAIVIGLLVILGSLSVHGSRRFLIVDDAGAPLDTAYVVYSYSGSRPNPVHPVSYRAGPIALARSDPSGRVVIPPTFHVHKPFPIETHPSLRVEFVYVPRLHNATARMSQEDRAVVADLTNQPELWQGSLWNIASMISQLTTRTSEEPPLRDLEPAMAALIRELIGHFRREYEEFLARYRDTLRPKPEMPGHVRLSSPEEQRRWQEFNDAYLAREPRWGMLVTRVFGDQVKLFNQRELELR
jgi:hypothetical protein